MADIKVTALAEATTASADDLLMIIDDPAGTEANKKITLTNFTASLPEATTEAKGLMSAADKIIADGVNAHHDAEDEYKLKFTGLKGEILDAFPRRNVLVAPTGTAKFSFDSATGTFTFSSLIAWPVKGGWYTIAAGSVVVGDGQVLCLSATSGSFTAINEETCANNTTAYLYPKTVHARGLDIIGTIPILYRVGTAVRSFIPAIEERLTIDNRQWVQVIPVEACNFTWNSTTHILTWTGSIYVILADGTFYVVDAGSVDLTTNYMAVLSTTTPSFTAILEDGGISSGTKAYLVNKTWLAATNKIRGLIPVGERQGTKFNPFFSSIAAKLTSKADISGVQSPKKVYTVLNDIINTPEIDMLNSRFYGIPLYFDHFVKARTSELDINFTDTGNERAVIFSPRNNDDGQPYTHNDVNTIARTLNISSNTYNNSSITFEQKSTKATVGKDSFPKLLCIGDSVTNGYLSNVGNPDVTKNPSQYWNVIKEQFEQDRIDGGNNPDEYNFMTIGRAPVVVPTTWTMEYGGESVALKGFCEGVGGWMSSTHLHWSRNWTKDVQGLWDLLGLGDGSGTDWTASALQKASLRTTPEGKYAPKNTAAFIAYINSELSGSAADYAAAVALLDAKEANPDNPFYDYSVASASGSTCAFSLATYLSRWKTLANDGVTRLVAGSTAGSKISNVNLYDVCLPTHIIIQHSFNDGDATWLATNYRIWTDRIKAECTANSWDDIFIGISIIDYTGTYYPSRFPEFDKSVAWWNYGEYAHAYSYNNLGRIFTEFWVDSANEDTEKIYILPTMHVQPTAWASSYRHVKTPEYDRTGLAKHDYRKFNGGAPNYHPNNLAHRAWGIEMYAWIKYTLSL